MNTRTYLAIFLIATSVAVATTSIATPALADRGSNGLDKADQNVHKNTPGGFTGDQDIRFHEGTCQGGHPVDIPGGCDNPAITDPGNSDNHRKDK